jgi:alpha-tubulin suppressor-like RCC1 family protein
MRSLAVAVLLLGACRVSGAFHCERDEQCRRGAEQGRCEAAGFCSFVDPGCPEGWRYDDLAGGGLSGSCVAGGGQDASLDLDAPPNPCFAEIEAGEAHVCVRKLDGRVWCWGRNAEGQLTSGLAAPQMTAAVVPSITGATKIAAGDRFTCVRLADDSLRCFGNNAFGQIGNGASGGSVAIPTQPNGLGAVSDFDAGGAHACAIASDTKVYCWGRGSEGQVGTGNTTAIASSPQEVQRENGGSLSGATAVATGGQHSCAIAGGAVYCWGSDANGELGDDLTSANKSAAVPVAGMGSGVVEIVAGSNHTCARKTDGTAWCWGLNDQGQLGNGSLTGNAFIPAAVIGLPVRPVNGFALGDRHTCAFVGSALWCWGSNAYGQVSDPAGSPIRPTAITDLGVPTMIAATKLDTCAIDGLSLRCRGANDQFQLAFGPADLPNPAPHPPATIVGVCE